MMAKSLKTRGIEELSVFKRRVNRQHSLERISTANRDVLLGHIHEMEAHIVNMDEKEDADGGSLW